MLFYYEKINDIRYKLTTQMILDSNVNINDLPNEFKQNLIEINNVPQKEEGKVAELYYDVNTETANYEYSQQLSLEEQINLMKKALNDLILNGGA